MERQEPASYHAWCEHYGYDPGSPEAEADYAEYLRQRDIVVGMTAREESNLGM